MINIFTDWRAWVTIITLTLVTLVVSVAKYQAGKQGLDIVKEKFPQVPEERWNQMGDYFERWGSPIVFLSFLPVLALIIPAAAGAYGISFRSYIFWAFLAKITRYWILAIIAVAGFRFFKNIF